jgi:hypothetical protein
MLALPHLLGTVVTPSAIKHFGNLFSFLHLNLEFCNTVDLWTEIVQFLACLHARASWGQAAYSAAMDSCSVQLTFVLSPSIAWYDDMMHQESRDTEYSVSALVRSTYCTPSSGYVNRRLPPKRADDYCAQWCLRVRWRGTWIMQCISYSTVSYGVDTAYLCNVPCA